LGASFVAEDREEATLDEILQARGGCRRPQQAFGREDHQGLAPRSQGRAPKEMEVLGGGRRLANLDVVFAGLIQEALDPSAGVLGSLSFIAVRKKEDQSREQSPLVPPRYQELIDDGLRAVGEITELCFPANQGLGKIPAVAVFEP